MFANERMMVDASFVETPNSTPPERRINRSRKERSLWSDRKPFISWQRRVQKLAEPKRTISVFTGKKTT